MMMENKDQKLPCGCPGTNAKKIERKSSCQIESLGKTEENLSQLNQWPVQIKLVSPQAAYLENADLLIAADCTAYAYGNFHSEFIKNRVVLIGCPKLDLGDYSEKLTEILKTNHIKSVTIIKMEVPCCKGIETAAIEALRNSGKQIPWESVTVSLAGELLRK